MNDFISSNISCHLWTYRRFGYTLVRIGLVKALDFYHMGGLVNDEGNTWESLSYETAYVFMRTNEDTEMCIDLF